MCSFAHRCHRHEGLSDFYHLNWQILYNISSLCYIKLINSIALDLKLVTSFTNPLVFLTKAIINSWFPFPAIRKLHSNLFYALWFCNSIFSPVSVLWLFDSLSTAAYFSGISGLFLIRNSVRKYPVIPMPSIEIKMVSLIQTQRKFE